MNTKFAAIRALFDAAEKNNEKYEKGNKSAGKRLRANLNDMRSIALEYRKEIAEANRTVKA